MIKLRLVILGASAVFALGTAGVLAMTETSVSGERDNHGAFVASAARTCPHGAGGVHGACVSSVARSNAGKDTADRHSTLVHSCQAANPGHDKTAHAAFKTCAQADKASRASDTEASEAPDTEASEAASS